MEVHIAAMTRRSRPKMRWQAVPRRFVCRRATLRKGRRRAGVRRESRMRHQNQAGRRSLARPHRQEANSPTVKTTPRTCSFGGRALMAQAEKERLQAKGRLRPQNSGVLTNKHVFRPKRSKLQPL